MNKIKEIIDLLQNTSGTNDKIEILKHNRKNETLMKVLEYTYNPYKRYGISKNILDTLSSNRTSSKAIIYII